MAIGQINRQESDSVEDKKLNPTRFTSQERNKLLRGLTDDELNSIEYDTVVYTQPEASGSSGKAGVNYEDERIDEFVPGNECEYFEFDPNTAEASEEELKNIVGLQTCNNLPEKLKDEKLKNVNILKDVGNISGKRRIKIEIKNNESDSCIFIESIKIITGTSNSLDSDKQTSPSIVQNSPTISEDEILDFVNSKIQITDQTPSSLIDGVITNIPPCLNSINDTVGILLGPAKSQQNEIDTGPLYVVSEDLPPGSDNLIGFIGSTGNAGISTHIHAEWASEGNGKGKYWTKDEFIQWHTKNRGPVVPSHVKVRDVNGRGFSTGKRGVAAYFTVSDLLKFVDIDMLPLKDQISGKQPLPATTADFQDQDRNYAQHRPNTSRYHYAIDAYPNAAKAFNGKAIRRMFLKPGVTIVSRGGSADGSTGNAVQLRHPDGTEILIYHLSAFWDNVKKVYYTYANPLTTLNSVGAGPASFSRNDISKAASPGSSAGPAKKPKPTSPCGVIEDLASYFIDVDLSLYENIPIWVLIEINGTFDKKTFFQYFENTGK